MVTGYGLRNFEWKLEFSQLEKFDNQALPATEPIRRICLPVVTGKWPESKILEISPYR